MTVVWLLTMAPTQSAKSTGSEAQENRKGVGKVGCVHIDITVLAAVSSVPMTMFPMPTKKMSETFIMSEKGP